MFSAENNDFLTPASVSGSLPTLCFKQDPNNYFMLQEGW